jgi:hypothetical protein
VLRTGKPELYPYIPDELLVERVKDPEQLAILRQVGFTSLVIVPLRARDQVLGALTLISAESGVRFDEKTVELAEDLGRRAGTAIDHARLFQEVKSALSAGKEVEGNLRYVMEHARCLLWHARIEATGLTEEPYRWELQLFDEEGAQRFIPLETGPGETYAAAFFHSRPEEDRLRCDRNAAGAFSSGASG